MAIDFAATGHLGTRHFAPSGLPEDTEIATVVSLHARLEDQEFRYTGLAHRLMQQNGHRSLSSVSMHCQRNCTATGFECLSGRAWPYGPLEGGSTYESCRSKREDW